MQHSSESMQSNILLQTHSSPRCTRSQANPEWTKQEVTVLLAEITAIDEAWFKELSSYQRWKMVSDNCTAANVTRSANQCKRKWQMLFDDYRKIIDWEESKVREDSYWLLSGEIRKDNGLPSSFEKEMFNAIDTVIRIQEKSSSSSDGDPERVTGVTEFVESNVNAYSVLKEALAFNSKITQVKQPTLNSSEDAPVLTGSKLTNTFITSMNFEAIPEPSKTSQVEIEIMEAVEEASKTSQIEIEIMEAMEEASKRSDERLTELKGLNIASKSIEERIEVEGPITISKRPQMEYLRFGSESPPNKPEALRGLYTSSMNLKLSADEEEEFITTSNSTTKATVMEVSGEKEELIASSKNVLAAPCPLACKLRESAEHVFSVLRGELQDVSSHCSIPPDSFRPNAAETKFARCQADELIKALDGLKNAIDEICEHIDGRGFAGNSHCP